LYSVAVIYVLFWSNCIISRRYLFSFCDIYSLSAIWYFVFRCFCVLFFSLLIMAIETDDSIQSVSVRLDENNYSYWSYVIKNFFKGKKMWGYVSGTYMIPKNTKERDAILIDIWEANNTKIITWINNSIKHFIGT
jgi:hypothetical protein